MHSANIGNGIFILIIPAIMTMELKHIFSPAYELYEFNQFYVYTTNILLQKYKFKKSDTRNA